MISAGIFGGSGYMGGEALRVLIDHPQVEVAWAPSRQPAAIEELHPSLYGTGIQLIHPDDAEPCDVVFTPLLDISYLAHQCRTHSDGANQPDDLDPPDAERFIIVLRPEQVSAPLYGGRFSKK